MSNEKKKNRDQIKEQTGFYDSFERYEIIGGIRYDFLSSPRVVHQVISAGIEQLLREGCQPDGVIIHAPMDVYLDEDNIVQPDIIYIQNENLQIIVDQKIKGAPDLLVEILSPSTGSRDKVMKKKLYEKFHIKEYWIVDPIHFLIDQFVLNGDKFVLHEVYSHGDMVSSPNFPCITIDMDRLFKQAERFMPKED